MTRQSATTGPSNLSLAEQLAAFARSPPGRREVAMMDGSVAERRSGRPFCRRGISDLKLTCRRGRRPLGFKEAVLMSAALNRLRHQGVVVAVRAKFSPSAMSTPGTRLEPPSECCLHRSAREYELISQILPELTRLARHPVRPRRPTTWLSPEGAPKREPEVGKVLRDRHS